MPVPGLLNSGYRFFYQSPKRALRFAVQIKRKIIARRLSHGRIEANTSEFKSFFPENAKVEQVATGFRFTEGPLWIAEKGCLLFSDIRTSRIVALTADRHVATFRQPSGKSNGLTLDKEGRLIACEHGNRRVTRTEGDGSITVLADSFQGKRLNSPNDVIVKSDGTIYFTDPPCGIKPEQQELSVQGVYRISPEGKRLTLVAGDFERPNGLAFSPNETRLYIDDSSPRRHIRVFEVQGDGSLANGRIFYNMNVEETGVPDGMKVDSRGHVYCTGAGGVWVFDEEGNHLGRIVTPEKPTNCAWGDDDWRSLYITAQTSVYRVRVNISGIPVPMQDSKALSAWRKA